MTDSTPQKHSYEFKWIGGGPGIKTPSSDEFSTESELLKYIDKVNEDLSKGTEGPYDVELYDTGKGSRRGGLAAGDAEVIVYLGDPPDPEPSNESGVSFDEAIVEGKVDAAVVLQDGEVKHEKLEDPV